MSKILFGIVWVFVFVHFLKDLTQDILHIATPLDLLGDVNEDISIFPVWLQTTFNYFAYLSFIGEIFLIICIPLAIRLKSLKLIKTSIIVFIVLIGYLGLCTALDPRFSLSQVTHGIINTTPSSDLLLAPGKDFPSTKKVENYFTETMHMTSADAANVRSKTKGYDGKISFRLTDKTTLQAVVSNLYYYGFIRDEKAFMYALENTKDTVVGKSNALKIGKTGSIDVGAYYRITEDMDAWQMADELLNKPTYFAYDEYNYMFMP